MSSRCPCHPPCVPLLWGAVCLLLLAMTGCRGLPKTSTLTATELITDWREAKPQAVPETLTLLQAKEWALRGNPDLQTILARVQVAVASVEQEQAAYWPSLTGDLTAVRQHQVSGDATTFSPVDRFNRYTSSFRLSWLAYDANARRLRVRAAEAAVTASEEAYHESRRLLVNAVALAYYDCVLAQLRAEIAQADVAFQSRLAYEAKRKQEAGTAARAEVNNFRLRTNSAKVAKVDAEQQGANARVRLATLMGLRHGDQLMTTQITANTQVNRSVPAVGELLELAAVHRPDLRQIAAELAQAKANAKAARSALFPQLSFFATTGTATNKNPGLQSEDVDTAYGVTATWNIFQGGAIVAAYRGAVASAEAAVFALEKQWQAIVGDIHQQLVRVNATRKTLAIQKESLGIAEQIQQDVAAQYKAGLVPVTRLNEAQRDLVVSRDQHALTQVQLAVAYENLDAFTGQNLRFLNNGE